MSTYRRAIVRLTLLALMVMGAALLNTKPVKASVSCQTQCSIQENNCVNNCHGSGTCRAICGQAFQMCLKGCW